MLEPRSWRSWTKSLASYLFAACVIIVVLIGVLRLWRADMRVPFAGQADNDARFTMVWIKGIIENGWYLHNPSVGAPDGLDMRDFPLAESTHFAIFKVLAWFTRDVALIHNLYYLLGFPLAALSSLLVLRHFRVSYFPALAVSVLFAFLPYHFLRLTHLFLAAYYLIPLLVMIILWVYLGRLPFFRCAEGQKPNWQLLSGKTLAAILICILVGSGGIYYAFFGCFLLLVAGAAGSLERRNFYALWSALALVAVITGTAVCNIAPHIAYVMQHGANSEAGRRYHYENEMYGLRIVQMLLPIASHRIGGFANVRARYDATTTLINENANVTLGVTGSVGFLLLLAHLLIKRRNSESPQPKDGLAILNIFAVLLGAMGGFGSLFGLLVSPQIRAYNRISIFIAFLSFFAVALVLDKLGRKCEGYTRRRLGFQALLAVLLALGMADQTTWLLVPQYTPLKTAYQQEKEYVRRIEASVPKGAMIFQLPYTAFPEHPRPVNELRDYDQFRCYLHSKHLRWSYGCMKSRAGDLRLRATVTRDVDDMVRTVALAGYSGIHIDCRGYDDHAAALEAKMTALLSAAPLRSADGHLLFFHLADYSERLRHGYSPSAWDAARQVASHPVTARWADHFNTVLGDPLDVACYIHWSNELVLDNPLDYVRTVQFQATCLPNGDVKTLFLESEFFSREIDVSDLGKPIIFTIDLPPGRHAINFRCHYRSGVPTPREKLVLAVMKVQFKELN